MAAAIEIRDLAKEYPAGNEPLTVLRDIDLRIEQGEFVSLVGPSGCGKSTLLNLIAGFVAPSRGEIDVRGQRVRGIHADLGLGYVTQDNKLFPWLTLEGNVEFPLRARGWSPTRRRQRVRDLLRLVGLEGFEDRLIYQLSGGMQKRAALAQAMSYDPAVLLMDEPFGPLDAQTRMILQEELLDLWQQTRKTILFVTHDLTEAIALSDRVLVMTQRPGRLKGVVPITIPRPRDVFRIHEAPGFAECYERIWELLRDELALTRSRRKGDDRGRETTVPHAFRAGDGGAVAVGAGLRKMDRSVDGQ